MRFLTAFICLVICVAAIPVAAFDFSDARKVVGAADPRISPDGTRVVYVRSKADFENDRTDRALVLVDVRTPEEFAAPIRTDERPSCSEVIF